MDQYFPRLARGLLSHPRPEPHPDALGLGIVGIGEGRTAAVAAYTRTSNVRTVAACDLDEDLCDALTNDLPEVDTTTSYDDLLARNDVDLVGVYTPDARHGEHVCRALEAGKDVVVTKPMVNSPEDAKDVLATAKRTGRRVFVGQSTRFFAPFRRQRAAAEAGDIGQIEVVDAHYIHLMDWYYPTRPWAAAESDWVFLGMSHPLDLLRWYLGPIRTVTAMASRSAVAEEAGASRDIYTVNVVSAAGRIGRAFGHYGAHELATARNSVECMLYGTDATSLARYHDMQYLYTDEDGFERTEDMLYELRHYHFNNEVHGMHYGEFANYLDEFASAIIEDRPTSPEVDEAVDTYVLMHAVARSADQDGAPVSVPELHSELLT